MFLRPETGVRRSPGAAGERVARPQLPQQVLLAVLGDQPPCAHAELPVGLWPELSLALSPLVPFFLGRAEVSFAVCPWDFSRW